MRTKKKTCLEKICEYLPDNLSSALMNLPDERVNLLCEIRIRCDKPVALHFTDEHTFIAKSGRITSVFGGDLMSLGGTEIERIFYEMCRYSVHSYSHNIAQGFITLENGCRVGLYGTAVTDGNRVLSVRSIRGFNIRVSGEYRGVGDEIYGRVYRSGLSNVLICGAPATGKTTMLRDLCRSLSERDRIKVCYVDERGEAENCELGVSTDLLLGYPKAAGVQIAVRTLSPQMVIFDELGTTDEVNAVLEGMNTGTCFMMSLHCRNLAELSEKPQFRLLKRNNAVDFAVFLKGIGSVDSIVDLRECKYENGFAGAFGTRLHNDGTVHILQNDRKSENLGKATSNADLNEDSYSFSLNSFR